MTGEDWAYVALVAAIAIAAVLYAWGESSSSDHLDD